MDADVQQSLARADQGVANRFPMCVCLITEEKELVALDVAGVRLVRRLQRGGTECLREVNEIVGVLIVLPQNCTEATW